MPSSPPSRSLGEVGEVKHARLRGLNDSVYLTRSRGPRKMSWIWRLDSISVLLFVSLPWQEAWGQIITRTVCLHIGAMV